jgi:transposase
MRRTELRLSAADRREVDLIRATGLRSAREVNRAHVLRALDQGIPEAQIMSVLGVGRMMVWRTRAAYNDGGLGLAVRDVARSGRPPKYGAEAHALVSALACSQAPAGSSRWTIDLLLEAARKEPGLGAISRATILRILKKTA